MDISPPTIDKMIPIGANQTVIKLTVDALSTTSTSTVLDFLDNIGTPALKNVISDNDGKALAPATVDGTLTIEPFSPLIQTITGNSGSAGKVFTVVGKQFNRPGLAVTICGKAAVHQLEPDGQTLTITAPDCTAEGWSVLAICNSFGCDSRAEGFNYLPPPRPEIVSFLDNAGLAGKQFIVVGRNFDQPGLTVKVCGATAVFQVLNGQTLRVTAPACAIVGAAPIEICNVHGCISNPAGFNYEEEPVGTPFIRGDANEDTIVDISDAVTILGDLFLGDPAPARCRDALDANDDGAADISDAVTVLGHLFLGDGPLPPPFPNPGLDPTLDPLPPC
jgi:hypothetical protein